MPSLYIGEQPVRTVALASNNDDATAVAADVMKDKIAYNQYGKIVGTAEPAEDLDSEMTAQDSLIEQIKSAVASKASVSYPTLSNPASAGNIESGYEAIDGSGSKITGTAKIPQSYAFSAYYGSTGSASSGSLFSKYASSYTTTCEVTPQHGDLVALDDLGDSMLFVMEASGSTHYIIWNMSGAAINMFDKTITGTLLRNWR